MVMKPLLHLLLSLQKDIFCTLQDSMFAQNAESKDLNQGNSNNSAYSKIFSLLPSARCHADLDFIQCDNSYLSTPSQEVLHQSMRGVKPCHCSCEQVKIRPINKELKGIFMSPRFKILSVCYAMPCLAIRLRADLAECHPIWLHFHWQTRLCCGVRYDADRRMRTCYQCCPMPCPNIRALFGPREFLLTSAVAMRFGPCSQSWLTQLII